MLYAAAGRDFAHPDAGAFISTLIGIYTLLITVIAALLTDAFRSDRPRGTRHGRSSRPVNWFGGYLRLLSVLLLFAVLLIDLWRIENSLGDLYGDAIGSLTGRKLHDVRDEARYIWLPASFTVVLLAVILRIQRDRAGRSTTSPRPDAAPRPLD